jgi:hypothetical protein
MTKKILVFMSLLTLVFSDSILQAKDKDEVAEILTKFKNYRFGAVNVYRIVNVEDIKQIVQAKSAKKDGAKVVTDTTCLSKVELPILKEIQNGLDNELDKNKIKENIINQGYTPPADDIFDCAFEIYKQRMGPGLAQLNSYGYIVTTRPKNPGDYPEKIIGVLYKEIPMEDDENKKMKDYLELMSSEEIFSADRLKDESIDEVKYGYKNMYDMVYNYFRQGNVENKSMEAKGIADDVRYFPPIFGNSTSLITGDIINSSDIQRFKRISEGSPEDMINTEYELLVAADQIRWIQYEKQFAKDKNGKIAKPDYRLRLKNGDIVKIDQVKKETKMFDQDAILNIDFEKNAVYDSAGRYFNLEDIGARIINQNMSASNGNLPKFGVELKYGIEDINYTSFWSERLAVNAIWKNVKFGVILPTAGWSSLSTDLFKQDRKLTYASVGLQGKLDFPFVLIPRSDVFSLTFGYVFGDAQESSWKKRSKEEETFNPIATRFDRDYLIRANAQLLYTFAISIDKDYFLRFGIGPTMYSAEAWGLFRDSVLVDDALVAKINYKKDASQSKTVAGISGKIEFMATNNTTPYGAGVQYFDETLSMNAWLQIPVIENTFSIKLDASGYFVAFRKTKRAWENDNVITPMIRFIYTY